MSLITPHRSPLTIGQNAPEFIAPDQHGETRTLADFRDGWLLLYFYHGDNTPGCTTQACTLRDHYRSLQPQLEVLGVSQDSSDSHAAFIRSHKLPFDLLSDPSRRIALSYGVGGWFPKRVSYLIGPDGVIRGIYSKRRATKHVEEVLADAENILETIFAAS